MKSRMDLAKSWFTFADEDMKVAEQLLKYSEPVFRSICFHCQQAVEKYIKGLIIYLDGDFSYTHDISLLLNELLRYEKKITFDDIRVEELSAYAVEARYPDPENVISPEQANEAFLIAQTVKDRIVEFLKAY